MVPHRRLSACYSSCVGMLACPMWYECQRCDDGREGDGSARHRAAWRWRRSPCVQAGEAVHSAGWAWVCRLEEGEGWRRRARLGGAHVGTAAAGDGVQAGGVRAGSGGQRVLACLLLHSKVPNGQEGSWPARACPRSFLALPSFCMHAQLHNLRRAAPRPPGVAGRTNTAACGRPGSWGRHHGLSALTRGSPAKAAIPVASPTLS
jgi:hypothetical protein